MIKKNREISAVFTNYQKSLDIFTHYEQLLTYLRNKQDCIKIIKGAQNCLSLVKDKILRIITKLLSITKYLTLFMIFFSIAILYFEDFDFF